MFLGCHLDLSPGAPVQWMENIWATNRAHGDAAAHPGAVPAPRAEHVPVPHTRICAPGKGWQPETSPDQPVGTGSPAAGAGMGAGLPGSVSAGRDRDRPLETPGARAGVWVAPGASSRPIPG